MAEDIECRNYVEQPFGMILLDRLEELREMVGITRYALAATSGTGDAADLLNYDQETKDRFRELEAKGAEQVATDYPLLHGSATVLLWGALEAAVRDFAVRVLERFPAIRTGESFRGFKIRVADYEALDTQDRMRFLLEMLERETGAPLKPGIGRFDVILQALGVSPRISSAVRRDLAEMAATRNILVHRASIVDARFIALCPDLGLCVGDKIRVSGPQFHRYEAAVLEFMRDVVVAARASLFDAKPSPENDKGE